MKLSDLRLIKLLPAFMRQDTDVIALSKAMDHALRDDGKRLPTLATWGYIDQLTEQELDELAWEFDVDWYDSTASKDVKINQIQTAQLIKKRRGTKWAVEQALKNVIGNAWVREWFDFDGDPFTFEAVIKNPAVDDEMHTRAIRQIEKAKNVRSQLVRVYYLDEVSVSLTLHPVVHDGTFKLLLCGIPKAGDFLVTKGDLAQGQIPIGFIALDDHRGTFTLEECGDFLMLQSDPKPHKPLQAGTSLRIGSASYPMCGVAACGGQKEK